MLGNLKGIIKEMAGNADLTPTIISSSKEKGVVYFSAAVKVSDLVGEFGFTPPNVDNPTLVSKTRHGWIFLEPRGGFEIGDTKPCNWGVVDENGKGIEMGVLKSYK